MSRLFCFLWSFSVKKFNGQKLKKGPKQTDIVANGISVNHFFVKKLIGIIINVAIIPKGNNMQAIGANFIDMGLICPAYAAKIVAPATMILIAMIIPIDMLRNIFIVIILILFGY